MKRWRTIRLTRVPGGWVWADRAGWGDGLHSNRIKALISAVRGK